MKELNNSKFVTKKWNTVNDQSNANYNAVNKMTDNTKVLKSNLCDYNDVQVLIKGDIAIIGHQVTQVAFKNCAPFANCITKTDGTTIDDGNDLDLVMPMYNLIEYCSNYFEKSIKFRMKLKIC